MARHGKAWHGMARRGFYFYNNKERRRMQYTKKLKVLQLDEMFWKREFYPRSENCPNWQAVYQYSVAMKNNSIFPPITVVRDEGKYLIIDGVTRYEASKRLNKKTLHAYIINLPRDKWYELSVELNVVNGQRFSPYELSNIILKLRGLHYSEGAISEIVRMPLDNIKRLTLDRIVKVRVEGKLTRNGKPIFEDKSVKHVMKHYAGKIVENNLMEIQSPMYGWGQEDLLDQLISLLESKSLDMKNEKIIKKLITISELIGLYSLSLS
jgi:hypothetical protein